MFDVGVWMFLWKERERVIAMMERKELFMLLRSKITRTVYRLEILGFDQTQ